MNFKGSLKPSSSATPPLSSDIPQDQGDFLLELLSQGLQLGPFDLMNLGSFPLGAELLSYRTPVLPPSSRDDDGPPQTGYLVLKGRVRLLCNSDLRSSPYAAAILQAGDLFGADHWFSSAPLPYQTVAASHCQVVPITYAQMIAVREQHPGLWAHWQAQMRLQVQLLFFKRYTPLQVLPSSTLAGLLRSRLKTFKLEAGKALKEIVMPYAGYFWVRSGRLFTPTSATSQLMMGSGWRDRAFADYVAAVPSQIYQLQFQPWETGEMFPILEKLV